MKTLPLLVCICALSACFSLSEGQKQQRKIHHKKNNVRQYTLDHRSPFHPQFRPDRRLLQPRPRKPSNSIRKDSTLTKYIRPPKCPVKNSTVVNNNTSEATTQIPSVSPTSTSTKIVLSPGVTSLAQNATTISARENKVTAGSSATTPAPQPSPTLVENTAAPPTSSPAPPETTAAPATPAPQPSPAPQETTAAPVTSAPAPPAPQPSPAPPETTAAPVTSAPAPPASQPSPAPPETTAAPATSVPATPAPQPSSTSLETTAAPNTTPNPSPTTFAPETSQTTAAPTAPTPATTQTTTVKQPTSPSPQNTFPQFWLAINKLWERFLRIIQQQ